MTIRNFLPGFGMRTVAALAVAAVVVVAALLAVGSPASAQSSDGEEIWSGTITVGLHNSMVDSPAGFHDRSSSNDYGSLDDDTFTFDGTNYTIAIINDLSGNNGTQTFAIAPKPSDPEKAAWTFHMSGRTFNLGDATITVDDGNLRGYQFWNQGRLSWSENDEVAVKLTALPIITIEAVTTTVEYGGNNNAAESTAEFKFTRTGSTDNALSFRVTNGNIFGGETATRTFKAGVSSFSNFHWAVDLDNNDAPLCLILWQLRTGNDYVLGTPDAATVGVEGPGTTCMGSI